MTEDEIRIRAKEAGLSVETADSMVESSRVADNVRASMLPARYRVEHAIGVDGSRVPYFKLA